MNIVPQNNRTMHQIALAYARYGWPVFPTHTIVDGACTCGKPNCGSPGKHPAISGGFKNATLDPDRVAKFFDGRDRNIGIATGATSSLWVLDLDGDEGIEALRQLEAQHGALPPTVSVRTGGGGRHLFFAYPGTKVKNTSRIGGLPIDSRGDGGYIVAPPSRHVSGRSYKWERHPDDTETAKAPDWLLQFVNGEALAALSMATGGLAENTKADPEALAALSMATGGLVFTIGNSAGTLADTPGAPKGERHATATRLIGAELAKGTNPAEVAASALAWAKTCQPPMDEGEILRIVSDLGHRDQVKTEADLDEFDLIPLPDPPPWPELGQDALYGLAGEIVSEIAPHSEADPMALLLQVLVSFGCMVGRSAYYPVEGTKHHANLYAVLVGSTAKGRKGTSEGRTRGLFREVDEKWTDEHIVTGLVSGEGLTWHVRDPIWKVESIKEKGRVVGSQEVLADPGVEDKRLLVIEPEFAGVCRVAKRETNTLSPTLRCAWDSGHIRTLAKNNPAKATDAHIAIVGHITREELVRVLDEVEAFSGFSNRFLWCLVRRSKLLPDGGEELDLGHFIPRMRSATERARKIARMTRERPARELWATMYSEMSESHSGLLGASTSRAEAQVLRLSIVYALLDGSPIIRVPHLLAARAVWDYCQASAAIIFGRSSGDDLADKLLAYIQEDPGIRRRDLRRRFSGKTATKTIIRALATLRDQGMAHCVVEKCPKPSERWFPGRPPVAIDNTANTPPDPASIPGRPPVAIDNTANTPTVEEIEL